MALQDDIARAYNIWMQGQNDNSSISDEDRAFMQQIIKGNRMGFNKYVQSQKLQQVQQGLNQTQANLKQQFDNSINEKNNIWNPAVEASKVRANAYDSAVDMAGDSRGYIPISTLMQAQTIAQIPAGFDEQLANEAKDRYNKVQENYKLNEQDALNRKKQEEKQQRYAGYDAAFKKAGFKSREEVAAWQKANGLKDDGLFGEKSQKLFNKLKNSEDQQKQQNNSVTNQYEDWIGTFNGVGYATNPEEDPVLRRTLQGTANSQTTEASPKEKSFSQKWHDFWNKPETITYAYGPHDAAANGPHTTTQKRSTIAKEVATAAAAPFLTMSVAAAPLTTALNIGGSYIGSQALGYGAEKATEYLGGDEYDQELAGDVGRLVGGYTGYKGPNYVANKISKGNYDAVGFIKSLLGKGTRTATGNVRGATPLTEEQRAAAEKIMQMAQIDAKNGNNLAVQFMRNNPELVDQNLLGYKQGGRINRFQQGGQMSPQQQQMMTAAILGIAVMSNPKNPEQAIQQVMSDEKTQQEALQAFAQLPDNQKDQCLQIGAKVMQQLSKQSKSAAPQSIGSMQPTYNAAPTPTPYGDDPNAAISARRGAKLNHISQLNGKCPEGYEVEKYLIGGCVKCRKGKVLSLAEQLKCGGKKRISKKENGSVIPEVKCGKKMKKRC